MDSSKSRILIDYIKRKHGVATFSEIKRAGFDKKTLRALIESEQVTRSGRALYRLREDDLSNPDLVTVAIKAPRAVVCLISALYFHRATDHIPRQVDLAIPRGVWATAIDHPPVRYYRLSKKSYEAGIEEHQIDGRTVKIYSLAKTIADCFKFRSRIGIDVARYALKEALSHRRVKPQEVLNYAEVNRVSRVVKPVLEALL